MFLGQPGQQPPVLALLAWSLRGKRYKSSDQHKLKGAPAKTAGSAYSAKPELNTIARGGCRQLQLSGGLRSAGLAALANVLAVLPAHAEAGKIFDFNLTLPIMATQFLLLMVFLDKTWFGPVGKALDERDANLRAKLGSVKDNSGDLKKLQDEAEQVLREARQAAQAMIKEAKSKTQEEQGKKLAETKEVHVLLGCMFHDTAATQSHCTARACRKHTRHE